ncbi:pyrroline-5-carboxylate reductase family protein [Acerihabitans arboris]|uniref:Pyrroline-5-carboxylate reductase n=1 Tax=Acerihabitans arboris TaxID=2691583 RepID=A0A845SIF1_9GAMM|nr:pyrroline-5-carboxylate reductase [Acerihabitans arboris]NDL63709.1 pyrroline-5-carboxylate reductase [Acerihabitans arboris]
MMKVHFIGAGQMVEAIVRAAVNNGKLRGGDISIEDIDPARVSLLTGKYGVAASKSLAGADLVVIAVRPQDNLGAVAKSIVDRASDDVIVVSIVAGVTLAHLDTLLGAGRPVARVIPNTLTDTGYGFSGVVLNERVRPDDIQDFLESFGKVLYLEERMLDIFTGFAIAGPNYIYYFIESLTDAGVLAGLPRAQATAVVMENLVGAVEMLKRSQLHPRQLLDINNSPAGVGMHGLYELNNSDFAAGLQRSVLAAVKRTTQLANE